MARIAACLLLGIGVGLGFAYWQGAGSAGDDFGSGLTVQDRASLERRLSELETSLALERYERQAIADELDILRASVAELPEGTDGLQAPSAGERLVAVRDRENAPQSREARAEMLRQRQIDNYVAAGFSPDRALWLMEREESIAMDVLQARYLATQNGASPEDVAGLNSDTLLRQELGDTEYEQYLAGRGRQTTINVREVLSNSPAQSAGLRAGDEIVAYNGKRVFEISELTSATNEAQPGLSVPVDVLRDGQRMQIYVPSGPLGISGGGRSRR